MSYWGEGTSVRFISNDNLYVKRVIQSHRTVLTVVVVKRREYQTKLLPL